MQKEIARFISIILSPFILAIAGGFFFSYKGSQSQEEVYFWTAIVGAYTAVVAAFIVYGVKRKFFTNLDISNRKERFLFYPFLLATLIAFTSTTFILNAPPLLKATGVFLIPTIFIFELLNKRIKGSIHTASVAAATVGFAVYYSGWVYILLLLIPLVVWSRVTTNKHSLSETVVGGVYGALFAMIGLYVVQFFR